MTACLDQDEALTLLAAGALEPPEEARVRAHLESCAACRSELRAQQEVLGLCALPPPSAREQAILASLPRTTVGAWRQSQVRQASRLRTTGALLAAAAVLLLALGPGALRPWTASPPTEALGEPLAGASEEVLELEQWALADPLGDELELAEADLEETDPGLEGSAFDVEDDLFNDPGDSP